MTKKKCLTISVYIYIHICILYRYLEAHIQNHMLIISSDVFYEETIEFFSMPCRFQNMKKEKVAQYQLVK